MTKPLHIIKLTTTKLRSSFLFLFIPLLLLSILPSLLTLTAQHILWIIPIAIIALIFASALQKKELHSKQDLPLAEQLWITVRSTCIVTFSWSFIFLVLLYSMSDVSYDLTSTSGFPFLLIFICLSFLLLCISTLLRIRHSVIISRSLAISAANKLEQVFSSNYTANGDTYIADYTREIRTLHRYNGGIAAEIISESIVVPIYICASLFMEPIVGAFCAIYCIAMIYIRKYLFRLSILSDDVFSKFQFHSQRRWNGDVLDSMGLRARLAHRWRIGLGRAFKQTKSFSIYMYLYRRLYIWLFIICCFLIFLTTYSFSVLVADFLPFSVALVIGGRAIFALDRLLEAMPSYVDVLNSLRTIDSAEINLFRTTSEASVSTDWTALHFDGIGVQSKHASKPILSDIDLKLERGDALAIVGPSGSGKSTLLRTLIGVVRPSVGTIRVDGVPATKWMSDTLGSACGYLPESADLFPGTIAENIAGFREASFDEIHEAAREAHAIDTILGLPDGFDTQINEEQHVPAEIRFAIALARAIFRRPTLLALDIAGYSQNEKQGVLLENVIRNVCGRGGTVIYSANTKPLISAATKVALLNSGRIEYVGPAQRFIRDYFSSGLRRGPLRESDVA